MTNHARRRQVLTTLGGALAGGTLVAATGDDATATAAVSVNDFTAENATAEGDVTAVRVVTDAQWRYDLPDDAPAAERWQVVLSAVRDGETAPIASTNGRASGHSATGTTEVAGSLLNTPLYDASDFDLGERQERSVDVGLGLTYTLVGGGQDLATAIAQAQGSVTVSRAGYEASLYGSVGGDAVLDVTTK